MGSLMRLLQEGLYKYAKIPPRFVNKYSVVTFIFGIWVCFIDTHSVWDSYQLSRTIDRLEKEKIQLKKDIEIAKVDRLDLEKNKEKFAREKYYMHKDNEEVFIIERE